MPLNFLKTLDADDIFISYSRRDGSAYLTGLDAALSKQGFSCFTDKRGTDAGRLPPETLYRKVRACKTLVLLASPGAQERPENITPELEKFAEQNGTSRIICVSFDGGAAFDDFPADWEPFVVGKAREREAPEALTTGTPSEAVVAAVVAASDYMKSKDRLRKYRNRALGVLGALVVAIAVAAVIAGVMFRQAAAATKEAAAATTKANEAIARADAETARATKASEDARNALAQAEAAQAQADRATKEANRQKEIADRATEDAKAKTKLAEEAARKAEEASARADREQARAERQGTIADATSLAIRSQTVLRRRPEDVSSSLKYAVDSMNKFLGVGVHGMVADAALRESLALFPRLRSSYVLAQGTAAGVTRDALSPDGRHFALLADGTLRVYESAGRTLLKTVDCKCSGVALSSGAVYAAAIMEGGGINIINLTNDSSTKLPLPHGVAPEEIALSPGGRYLALTFDAGRRDGLMVVDVSSGRVFKSFGGKAGSPRDKEAAAPGGGDLRIEFEAVAFGPSGNLAAGGTALDEKGTLSVGRAVFWGLRMSFSKDGSELKLLDEDFNNPEFFQQKETVHSIAPGADMTYFAANDSVWKRLPGGAGYEPVARLPYVRDFESNSYVVKMAFDPDRGSLSLVRQVAALKEADTGRNENILEVWDATGHWDLAHAAQPAGAERLGFSPDGQFVVAWSVETGIHQEARPGSRLSSFVNGHLGRVYRTSDGEEIGDAQFEWKQGDATWLPTGPDPSHFVIADGGSALLWDVWEKKKVLVSLGGALNTAEQAALGRGGKFLALYGPDAKGKPLIVVYQLEGDSYNELKRIPQPANPTAISLSADGRRLATLYPHGVRVWDVGNRRDDVSLESLKLLDPPGDTTAWNMSLSPDGRFLAVTDSKARALLLDLSGGRGAGLLLDSPGIEAGAVSLAFSHDGRYVGVGSSEGLLHVFDTKGTEGVTEVARLQHTGAVTAVAFSDDGNHVATSTNDVHAALVGDKDSFPLRVWLLRPQALLAEAEARANSLRALGR
jgi:WD40 repeat protein